MAEAKPVTKPFQHDGKPVFVLIPQNSGYAKVCQDALNEKFPNLDAEVCTEIKIRLMPPDSQLYIMHPVKEKKKDSRNKLRSTVSTFISQPIDVFKTCSETKGKNSYRGLNVNAVCQAVTASCANDPAGLFFRGTLTSESKDNPDGLLLKISEQ